MIWAEPQWLALLVLLPVPWVVEFKRGSAGWSSVDLIPGRGGRWTGWSWVSPLIRTGVIVCLALAMARPQTVAGRTRVAGQGVAIIVALDRSSSMRAYDGRETTGSPSRFDQAKRTVDRFVAGRPDDLIGLVGFANYPDLNVPPTLDHETLRAAVRGLAMAGGGDDGTNIGDAIAWSIEALRSTKPARKVIVLVTDGANEPAVPEPLDPVEAARLARQLGVTVHTVAIGQPDELVRGIEPMTGLSVPTMGDGPDLALLQLVAEAGGGKAFHARGALELDRIFDEIDRLEKSPVAGTIRTRYQERFGVLVVAAIGLLTLDLLLAGSRFSRLP